MRKLTLLPLLALALAALVPGYAGARARRHATSRAFSGNDNATLHLVHASGSKLIEKGRASGALPGRVDAVLFVGTTFHGTFTIHTRGGEIFGRGSAKPSTGRGEIENFAGSLQATGGTGRFRGAHGSGRLYGSFNRRNYRILMRIRGKLYT